VCVLQERGYRYTSLGHQLRVRNRTKRSVCLDISFIVNCPRISVMRFANDINLHYHHFSIIIPLVNVDRFMCIVLETKSIQSRSLSSSFLAAVLTFNHVGHAYQIKTYKVVCHPMLLILFPASFFQVLCFADCILFLTCNRHKGKVINCNVNFVMLHRVK